MGDLERNIFKFLGLAVTGAVLLGVLRSDRARGAAGLITATGQATTGIIRQFVQ